MLVILLLLTYGKEGRNISFDRLCTSIPLAEWLLAKKITCIGTLQHNRKGILPGIKERKEREVLSSEIYWGKEQIIMTMSSYVVTTSKVKKNVLLLSTYNPLLGITKDDDKQKPGLYKLYDFTKGGTDIVDQKMGFYSTKSKSRRWTITALSYVLDMARVNATTIFAMNKGNDTKKQNAFSFLEKLVKQMVEPHIRNRNINGLRWIVKEKMRLFLMDKTVSIRKKKNRVQRKRGKMSCLHQRKTRRWQKSCKK